MFEKWVQRTSGPAAVVFVHGVLSSGRDCWTNSSGTYWPSIVASSAPELSVYVTTYRTGLDAGTFSINDVSDSLFEELELDGVTQRSLIVFVCHSMGGLVARRMLVAKRRNFVDKQIGLFLVASPSLGSKYANWLTPIARFFKHSQADTLRMGESNQWLSALDRDFFDLLDELDISGRELVEDLSILRLGLMSLEQIVSPLSGERFFRDPLKIGGSDHFSIAKPADTDALQHRVLMKFLQLRLSAKPRRSLGQKGADDANFTGAPESLASSYGTGTSEIPPTTFGSDAKTRLTDESLVDYILAANEAALAFLVASVPPGRGIGMPFVPDHFKRAYIEAVTGDNMGHPSCYRLRTRAGVVSAVRWKVSLGEHCGWRNRTGRRACCTDGLSSVPIGRFERPTYACRHDCRSTITRTARGAERSRIDVAQALSRRGLMKQRFLSFTLILCALLVISTQAIAEVSAQLRDQIMRQAASMALPATWVHEGLLPTGFLDDPKTREIVERSPAAYALAWAALQAEEKQSGAAVQLLRDVAQSIAAHHSDAIRHEPALIDYFSLFPRDMPVPPPSPRRFSFQRSIVARPDIAERLPSAARAMIGPMAKYAYAYPGGMQGMMVEVLRVAPTDAMTIERSSPDVGRALFTAIERAPVPPPAEVHLREVLAALLLHGGEAIRYEQVVRRVEGKDVASHRNSRTSTPLVAAQEARNRPPSAEERHEKEAITALAGQLIASLKQKPSGDDLPRKVDASPSGPLPPPPPGFSSSPTFNKRVQQLHSNDVEAPSRLLGFTFMRSIGGGLGGGGVVMGGPVAATLDGLPIGLSFRPIERSNLVVIVVAMSDGRVLFGPAVRLDVMVAAYRLGFGDSARGATPVPPTGTAGAVLISLLSRTKRPLNVSEFLVHPAISDLQIGRDLIVTDGAEFLFNDELNKRLGDVQNVDVPRSSVALSVAQWRAAMKGGAFGGWYRYVERPLNISSQQNELLVTAMNEPDRTTLFELVRPAEPKREPAIQIPANLRCTLGGSRCKRSLKASAQLSFEVQLRQ
ncbi:MAG: alpha/beta fold hydrolase [Paludibaculum sp.]